MAQKPTNLGETINAARQIERGGVLSSGPWSCLLFLFCFWFVRNDRIVALVCWLTLEGWSDLHRPQTQTRLPKHLPNLNEIIIKSPSPCPCSKASLHPLRLSQCQVSTLNSTGHIGELRVSQRQNQTREQEMERVT
ncbi:hypothetical protein BDV12DRAFT_92957 [Aspergillus spectabilis]